jgi:hypothetical protein
LLDGELPDIAGEQERHAALACELGIPAFVAGVGYEAIAGKYVADEFQGVVFEAVSTAKRRRAAEPRDVV